MHLLEERTAALNTLIAAGEGLKAIELFYADQVTMQENDESPRVGKATCLAHEEQNLRKVKAFSAKLLNQAIDVRKMVVFSEWEITVNAINGKVFRLTEVSVQHWENGWIVSEKFYYKEIKFF